jgi:hypothetical protein
MLARWLSQKIEQRFWPKTGKWAINRGPLVCKACNAAAGRFRMPRFNVEIHRVAARWALFAFYGFVIPGRRPGLSSARAFSRVFVAAITCAPSNGTSFGALRMCRPAGALNLFMGIDSRGLRPWLLPSGPPDLSTVVTTGQVPRTRV